MQANQKQSHPRTDTHGALKRRLALAEVPRHSYHSKPAAWFLISYRSVNRVTLRDRWERRDSSAASAEEAGPAGHVLSP